MKYGESVFDVFYLVTAILIGILILRKTRSRNGRLMGIAALVLGCGDAFHLVPRVLNYFVNADFTAALGVGKLVTSVTMTVFYVLVFYIGCACFSLQPRKAGQTAVWILAAVRVVLCLFPQNGWLQNDSSLLWGILRNVPFVILGVLIILLFYRNRSRYPRFRHIWLWVLLSFAFYIPVAVGAGILPMLGMLMLPKTVCYLVILFAFYNAAVKDGEPA